ncbi:MAG: UDP-N-acetylmuramoyl-tripeptide--D-alanyl-D-alanine ligase [Planctomycetota bacterium]
MIDLSAGDALSAAGATWSTGTTPCAPLVDVSTDTRTLRPGSLFVGVPGPRFDGAAFAEAAVDAGAVFVLAADGPGVRDRLAALAESRDVLVATVDDAVHALAELARTARERLSARVVAITGSNGKTSTKEILGHLMAASRRTVLSPASYNNHIGVPRTLFLADEATEALVSEVGTNAPGEIAALASIVCPDVAVVTNCGRAHLERLGSVEGVALEKGALVEAVDPGVATRPAAVLNRDCPRTPLMLERVREGVRLITVSASGDPSASVFARDAAPLCGGCGFVLDGPAVPEEHRGAVVEVPLLGDHAVANVLAALAAVIAADADLGAALSAVPGLAPAPHRLEPHRAGGVLVVDDAYNANPDSMRAAIEVLAQQRVGTDPVGRRGRRILAVGEMGELGELSAELHRSAGETARALGIDVVVGVGESAAVDALLAGARVRGSGIPRIETAHARTVDDAAAMLLEGSLRAEAGDVVLVKASRAAGLDRLAERLVRGLRDSRELVQSGEGAT